MDVSRRARALRLMIEKEAADLTAPKLPNPPSPPKPPVIDASNKPPILTSPSQPAIDIEETNLSPLPKMRINGTQPKFKSPMKSANPYNKQ